MKILLFLGFLVLVFFVWLSDKIIKGEGERFKYEKPILKPIVRPIFKSELIEGQNTFSISAPSKGRYFIVVDGDVAGILEEEDVFTVSCMLQKEDILIQVDGSMGRKSDLIVSNRFRIYWDQEEDPDYSQISIPFTDSILFSIYMDWIHKEVSSGQRWISAPFFIEEDNQLITISLEFKRNHRYEIVRLELNRSIPRK